MYLILLRYTRPLAEVEQVLPAHRDYLKNAPRRRGHRDDRPPQCP